MAIAQEEIFGPVLVIIPFKDEMEAISIANDSPTAWLLIYKLEVLLAQNAFHPACMLVPFTLMVVASIMAHRLVAINNRAMAAKAD